MAGRVTRIVPNLPVGDVTAADATAPVTPVVSVGVTDVDAAHQRAVDAGVRIVYPLHDEEWGVRRFLSADTDGNVINVVGHR